MFNEPISDKIMKLYYYTEILNYFKKGWLFYNSMYQKKIVFGIWIQKITSSKTNKYQILIRNIYSEEYPLTVQIYANPILASITEMSV